MNTNTIPLIITFKPLTTSHFSLLETWLNNPHVAQWYSQEKTWDFQAVHNKYRTYVDGYTIIDSIKKPIRGFIIEADGVSIGYIQYYYAYDFPQTPPLDFTEFPLDLAAIDIFIGNLEYTGKGLGPLILQQFLEEYIWNKFDACFVDPDTANSYAIKAYKKAGFSTVKTINNETTTWMLAKKDPYFIPKKNCKPLCCCQG